MVNQQVDFLNVNSKKETQSGQFLGISESLRAQFPQYYAYADEKLKTRENQLKQLNAELEYYANINTTWVRGMGKDYTPWETPPSNQYNPTTGQMEQTQGTLRPELQKIKQIQTQMIAIQTPQEEVHQDALNAINQGKITLGNPGRSLSLSNHEVDRLMNGSPEEKNQILSDMDSESIQILSEYLGQNIINQANETRTSILRQSQPNLQGVPGIQDNPTANAITSLKQFMQVGGASSPVGTAANLVSKARSVFGKANTQKKY